MKTNALIAILAGLMGGAVDPRFLPTERRTVKVRPANYTHPMVVSSPAEITAWNRDVVKKKRERLGNRNMRYFQQQQQRAIARRSGIGHIDRSAV